MIGFGPRSPAGRRLPRAGVALVLAASAGACSRPNEVTGPPARLVLTAGLTRQLAVIAGYRDGYRDTATARAEWRSSDSAVASVKRGLVEALAPGTTRVTVSLDGRTLTSDVTVVAVPPALPAAGPLRVSRSNPRYFETPDGATVYLTGSHTWNDFQDAGTTDPPTAFDYARYLAFLRAHGHNFMRLWTWE